MATGNCSVTATWNGTQQSVLLTWKNYPYLSAYTSVSPLMVDVNGTVNVTVKLTGDGWALRQSRSMLSFLSIDPGVWATLGKCQGMCW